MTTPAVIFDVDGVLVNSYQAHFASWSKLYHELGRDYTEAQFAADFGRDANRRCRSRRASYPALQRRRRLGAQERVE